MGPDRVTCFPLTQSLWGMRTKPGLLGIGSFQVSGAVLTWEKGQDEAQRNAKLGVVGEGSNIFTDGRKFLPPSPLPSPFSTDPWGGREKGGPPSSRGGKPELGLTRLTSITGVPGAASVAQAMAQSSGPSDLGTGRLHGMIRARLS